MSYSWRPTEIFRLLGISIPNRDEVRVPCPFCNKKNFGFNTKKGVGKCFQCGEGADSASYYAAAMGMTLYDARKDIERRLGIEDEEQRNVRSPRIVCVPETYENSEVKKAPDNVLDDTYRAFLKSIPLSNKNRNMLINRGLDNSTIDSLMYRTLPLYKEMDLFKLCRKLSAEEKHILKGVPGFYRAKGGKGDYTIIQMTQGIIMPQINVHNQITGLQIRKDDDQRRYIEEDEKYESKCGYFSSKGRFDGCGASANVHFACDFRYNTDKHRYDPIIPESDGVRGILLTEGIMKADITHFCLPKWPVISVPGVEATKQLEDVLRYLKGEYGLNTVALAYDMDYQTNPNVQKALLKTTAIIEGLGLKLLQRNWPAYVKVKNKDQNEEEVNLNGIDDFLVFSKFGIYPQVKKLMLEDKTTE